MKNFVLITLVLVLFSCAEKELALKRTQGEAFGTTYTIQYFTNSEFDIEKGLDSVFYAVNKSVSTYMPESDISKINKGDSLVVVDEIFKDVFRISEIVYKNSNGHFDPTVGVLRNAYGFGDVTPVTEIDSVVLDSLRKYVGFQKVQLLEDGKIWKAYPEIYFDFNAVAKGYGIDRVGAYLEKEGVANYVVELGGEVLVKGKNLSKDKLWVAGIESIDSKSENRSYVASVRLENQALAASGNYRKFRVNPTTGKKYVHTINPITGLAEETDVTSATIIAPTCAVADAYATACMAMGLDAAKQLLSQVEEIEGYLTYISETGEDTVFITKGFEKQLVRSGLSADGQ